MFVIALRHLLPFHPVRRSRERRGRWPLQLSRAVHGHIYMYICQHRRWLSNVRTWWWQKKTTRCSMHERKNVSTIRALSTIPNRSKTRSIENGESRNRVGHFSLSRCNVTLQLILYGWPVMIVHAQLHSIHLNLNEEWDGRSTSLIGKNTHKATRHILGTCCTKPTLSSWWLHRRWLIQ